MKTRILTSAFAICTAMVISDSFATNYDANQTYANSCTVGILGVSSGTKTATANFRAATYECDPGEYLPANATACATCPAGYYCDGDEYTFDEDEDQGANLCSDDYSGATSDAGATDVDACYKTLSCPTITSTANCDPHAATCVYGDTNSATNSGRYYPEDTGSNTVWCNVTFTCATGYTKTRATAPTLPSQNANDYQYRSHKYPSYSNNTDNDLGTGEWKGKWTTGAVQGTLKGISSCNTIPGEDLASTMPGGSNLLSNSADANDDTRVFCWCKPTSWTPSDGSTQDLSADWLLRSMFMNGSECASFCASVCELVGKYRSYWISVFNFSDRCVANTITVNWGDGSGGVHASSNCTYDGALNTPATAPTKRGHVFTGWSF